MAVVLEDDAKRLLADAGLPTPEGMRAHHPVAASDAASKLGRVVVKALVPAGGKQHGGGVAFADDPDAACAAAAKMLNTNVCGFTADAVLVEQRLDVRGEHYLALVCDGSTSSWQVVFSPTGGVDVTDRLAAGELVSRKLPADGDIREHAVQSMLKDAGLRGPSLRRLTSLVATVCRVGVRLDATLLEVNPLAELADGEYAAIGVLLNVDDRALYRHRELAGSALVGVDRVQRDLTAAEVRMNRLNERFPDVGEIRFSEFAGGDLGVMVMGGGAGLVTLDAIARAGGRPANFFDMTAGDVEDKLCLATLEMLRIDRLRGLFIGGGIGAFAPVPVRMRGIVRALRQDGRDLAGFPVVVRLPGRDDEEAAAVAAEVAGLHYFRDERTLEEAVEYFVELTERV